jgi:hypothetical protein
MMMLGNCPLQKMMMFTVPDAVTDDVYLKNLKINFGCSIYFSVSIF